MPATPATRQSAKAGRNRPPPRQKSRTWPSRNRVHEGCSTGCSKSQSSPAGQSTPIWHRLPESRALGRDDIPSAAFSTNTAVACAGQGSEVQGAMVSSVLFAGRCCRMLRVRHTAGNRKRRRWRVGKPRRDRCHAHGPRSGPTPRRNGNEDQVETVPDTGWRSSRRTAHRHSEGPGRVASGRR